MLFDLDDTLYDRSYVTRGILRELRLAEPALRRRGLGELTAEYGRLLEETHREVLAGRTDADGARIERYRRLLAFSRGAEAPSDDRRAARLAAQASHVSPALFRPVPGAVALVRALARRATVAIVTNQYRAEQVPKLERLGITPYVRLLACMDETGAAKPDPRAFRWALSELDVGPESAVMVGDSWETDILGARAAGIAAVWLNRSGRTAPPNAGAVITLRSLRPTGPTMLRLLSAVPGPAAASPNGS